jgi:hypothetical protein
MPQNYPLLPISLYTMLIKIHPCGKEFAMTIPRPDGVDDVAAQRHHLRMQLQSQIWDFSTPPCKTMPHTQKNHIRHDKSSAVISRSAPT